MYLKQISKGGVTRLYFYESFYLPNKKTSSRMVEALGRLDELQKIYPDPVTHFKSVAKERSAKKKSEKNQAIMIDMAAPLQSNEDNLKNVGYAVLT